MWCNHSTYCVCFANLQRKRQLFHVRWLLGFLCTEKGSPLLGQVHLQLINQVFHLLLRIQGDNTY